MRVTTNTQFNYLNNNPANGQQAEQKKQPSFGFSSGIPFITPMITAFEQNPMTGVVVLDVGSTVVPRTYVDTEEANIYAGIETFSREIMGTILHCVVPGMVAFALAKTFAGDIKKDYDIDPSKYWVNADTVDAMQKHWKDTVGNKKSKDVTQKDFENFFTRVLERTEGLDGTKWRGSREAEKFAKDNVTIEKIAETMAEVAHGHRGKVHYYNGLMCKGDKQEKLVEQALNLFKTKSDLRMEYGAKSKLSMSAEQLIRDSYSMATTFSHEKVAENIGKFTDKLKDFSGKKGIVGIATVIAMGSSVQYINRKITESRSGKEGFPGHKDFETRDAEQTAEDKKNTNFWKAAGISSLLGISALTIGKKGFNRSLFEFRSWFPTMNQAKGISGVVYASRMAPADDEEEVKTSWLRDVMSLLHLYVLGDFVGKGYIWAYKKIKGENHEVSKLLSKDSDIEGTKKASGTVDKLKAWANNFAVRSQEEIKASGMDEKLINKALKHKGISYVLGFGYSAVMLGVLLPKFNVWYTNRKKEQAQAKHLIA